MGMCMHACVCAFVLVCVFTTFLISVPQTGQRKQYTGTHTNLDTPTLTYTYRTHKYRIHE
jgi:preprotein translocase subunit YajC